MGLPIADIGRGRADEVLLLPLARERVAVAEDEVHLVRGAADVRAEHDGVRSLRLEAVLRELLRGGEELHIGATALQPVLELELILDHEATARLGVERRREACGDSVLLRRGGHHQPHVARQPIVHVGLMRPLAIEGSVFGGLKGAVFREEGLEEVGALESLRRRVRGSLVGLGSVSSEGDRSKGQHSKGAHFRHTSARRVGSAACGTHLKRTTRRPTTRESDSHVLPPQRTAAAGSAASAQMQPSSSSSSSAAASAASSAASSASAAPARPAVAPTRAACVHVALGWLIKTSSNVK